METMGLPINVAWIFLIALAILLYALGVRIVPQQSAFIVERLGRYHATLAAGLNFIVPFIDHVSYRHTLKEQAIDIPEQICITKDNVQVGVDGVLFLRVIDAQKASYGITNYQFAITQLAQTTLRSEVGKIPLDRTFEERSTINALVVTELDKATEPWGVKVLRYEIKNIKPPDDVLSAMEKQMRAEREKRAVILTSEGERDAKINQAEGQKQQVIKQSEASKQQQINVAQGQAEAIREVAEATAQAVRQVAAAISSPGGLEAINLRVAEQWVSQFGNVAKTGNTLILPANFGDMASLIAAAMTTIKSTTPDGQRPEPPGPKRAS
jgi:regulator of protease activity HflC (stomatin/prohibitin superfamily)